MYKSYYIKQKLEIISIVFPAHVCHLHVVHEYDKDKMKKNKHSTGNSGRHIVTTRGILIFEFSLRRGENGGKNAFSMLNQTVLLSNCILRLRFEIYIPYTRKYLF